MISSAILMRALPYVAAAVLAFGGGWTVRDWKAGADAGKALIAANKARDAAVAQAHAASASYEAQRAPIVIEAARSQHTIREVFKNDPTNAACPVPAAVADSLRGAIDTANGATPRELEPTLPAD